MSIFRTAAYLGIRNTDRLESIELELVSREGIEPSTRRLRVCCSAN